MFHCVKEKTTCLLYHSFNPPAVTSPNFPSVFCQTRPYASPAHTLSPFLGIFTPSQALGHSAFNQGFHKMHTKPRIQATTQHLINVQIPASISLHASTGTTLYDYTAARGCTKNILPFFLHFFHSRSHKTNFNALFLRHLLCQFVGSFEVVLFGINPTNG